MSVEHRFILRHGIFGKSQLQCEMSNMLRFGTRKSAKLVRCYFKREVEGYRVEIELHSAWLRKRDITGLADLVRLPELLVPSHIRFVQLDEVGLVRQLNRHRGTLAEVRSRASSIHAVLSYLRQGLGLANAHRLLRTSTPTEGVLRALKLWARDWARESPTPKEVKCSRRDNVRQHC